MNPESKRVESTIITSVITTLAVVGLIVLGVQANRIKVGQYLLGNASTASVSNAVAETDSNIVAAVKKANPAVVSIIITKNEPVVERYYQNIPDPFGGSIQIPQFRQNGTQPQEVGGGSGFLVSADGLIATNDHVVSDPKAEYSVYTNDGKKHSAKVVARDASQDIALVKIDGTNYSYLNFDSSQNLEQGQTVIAIGNALGEFRNTVSVGVISGLSRTITAGDVTGESEQLDEVLQTDAAINPGNSGGPLLDTNGNVVGMNVAVAAGSQNIGFAILGDAVKTAVDSVKAKGFISHPFLGIRYIPITDEVKTKNKLSVDYGILVSRGASAAEPAVIPNSPAAKAGIVENDIVLELDGVKLTSDQKFASLIRAKHAGDSVTLKILRNGQEKNVSLTLGEYNNQ